MHTKLKLYSSFLFTLTAFALAQAQTTAFTYNGRLNNNGAPVTGAYDLRFTIFDSSGGATVVAGPLPANGLGVTNGLFTTRLDFGAGVFTGPARWLEISVRPSGGGNFETLSPRQELTSSPYAIRAENAGTAADVVNGSVVKSLNTLKDNVTLAAGANVTLTPSGNTLTIASTGGGGSGPWLLNGSSAYYSGGNVGVGITTPASALEVRSANGNALLYVTAPRPNLIFRDEIAGNARSVIGGFGGGLRFYTESWESGANPSALMALDNNGNFGLGTVSPQTKLDIDVGSGQDVVRMSGQTPFLTFLDTTVGYRSRIQASGGDILLLTEGAINGAIPNAFLRLRGNGNVGIGTAGPLTTLDVRGALTLDGGSDAGIYTGTSASELNRYLLVLNSPNLQTASGLKAGGLLVSDSFGFANPGKNDLIVKGKVGVGTATPNHKLSLIGSPAWTANGWGGAVELENGAALGWRANAGGQRFGMGHSGGGFYFFRTASDPGATASPAVYDFAVDDSGNVGIGTTTPGTKLDVNGTTRTKILTITGGADIAEPFKMTTRETAKGSVVVIDEQQPGNLKLSTEPYDRRVAGIVSGANGINPGISLHQEGVLDAGENVALSGRVYVLADAANGAISPGDLLTTSGTPGHAMKAADHAKAQGAILGKAMSGLKEGKGMVLVLVTLQ